PVPNTIASNFSACPSAKVTVAFATEFIHGRTVMRPSATSGRYCWLSVTPAAKREGSGAGAPYCSGLPPASTTISFNCRSISAAGSRSAAMAPSRKYSMVGGDSRRELRQHIPLTPLGDHDATCADLSEFGGDLQVAVRAAGDEYALTAVRCVAPIVMGGAHAYRACEPVQPGTVGIVGDWNLPVATTTRSNRSVVAVWPTSHPEPSRLTRSTRLPNRTRDTKVERLGVAMEV